MAPIPSLQGRSAQKHDVFRRLCTDYTAWSRGHLLKEITVARDARSVSSRIQNDGQVGRVPLGLSDATGMSAKVFAELSAPIERLAELRRRDFVWG